MLKKLLFLAVSVFWAHCSYSESITPYYGQTGNAASSGYTWSMDNVFPSGVPGLDVQNIIYNYTIQKDVNDSVDVTIQNENALGSGYIFQEKDRWLPGSLGGTQINKAVPVIPNLPREVWGNGSIVTEGNGTVEDPTVVYTYRVDPCYDPQFDPNCPGYEPPLHLVPEPPVVDVYNAMEDENVLSALDNESPEYEDIDEEKEKNNDEEEDEDREMRLEKALSAADNSLMFAEAMAQAQILSAMNLAVNMTSYYAASIPTTTYKDSVVLVDKKIPENKNGLRNGLAQQLLHEKMIDMQY
jgi:hypothetical protein